MSAKTLLNPFSIALLYLIAGVLWILFSDQWVAGLSDNPEILTTLQTYKGWFYVIITAVPLYLLVNQYKQSVLKHANELRITEQHYEELFLKNPHPTAVVSAETQDIIAYNLNFTATLGFESSELTNLKLTDLVKQSELDILKTYLNRSDNQIPEIVEFRKKNGSSISLEVAYTRLLFNHADAMIFQFRDVTAELINREQVRKLTEHLEQEVAERTRELRMTNEELEAFTYSVSHDLKAPVRAIQSFGDAIDKDDENKLSEASALYLTRLRNAANKMSHLIDDLLRLSKVTRSGLEMQKTDISKLIAELVENLNNPHIHVNINNRIYVYADERLIKILLDNILSNAVKFSSKVDHPSIEIGCSQSEQHTELYIKDNGIGIDMEKSIDIFRPFQRMVREEEYPGFGIGLAVARRIVTRHGGTMHVVSKPGMGATFYIRLPH